MEEIIQRLETKPRCLPTKSKDDYTNCRENDARKRHGLVNVVSDVGKYLFGFSTERHIESQSAQIASLANQTENISHRVDQQLRFVKIVASQTLHNGEEVIYTYQVCFLAIRSSINRSIGETPVQIFTGRDVL